MAHRRIDHVEAAAGAQPRVRSRMTPIIRSIAVAVLARDADSLQLVQTRRSGTHVDIELRFVTAPPLLSLCPVGESVKPGPSRAISISLWRCPPCGDASGSSRL